jgi:hypothetical protein
MRLIKILSGLASTMMLLISLSPLASVFAGTNYCSFNGILPSRPGDESQFNMLLEPSSHPNFYTMSSVVGGLTVIPNEDLSNNDCPVVEYIFKMLAFYENNKKELQKKHPEIAEAIELIKNRVESNAQQDL